MASGIEILMKSLGIDPNEIRKAIDDTTNGISGGLQSLDNRLKNIEAMQWSIADRITRIEQTLNIKPDAPRIESCAVEKQKTE